MAEDTVVELSKNGLDARVIFAKDIEIKDIWNTVMEIRNGNSKDWSEDMLQKACEDILYTWALAHHLKDHIIDREE